MRKLLLLPLLVAVSTAAFAQAAPDGPPGGHDGHGGPGQHGMPMGGPAGLGGGPGGPAGPGGPGGPNGGVPSPEMLALVPGLSVAQQVDLRKLLIARRDAHDALRDKERTEHERIDDQSAEKIRKLLGEDGYVSYVQAGHGPGHDGPPHGDRREPPDRPGADGKGRPTPPPAPPAPPAG